MRPHFLLSTTIAALVSTTAAAAPTEGPVRIGQTAWVGGPRVTPLRVIEDSRCPMNARCVRAGTVIVRARVSGGRWSRTIDLRLAEPTPVADGSLTLVAVTPDRVAGKPLRPERLRFTFDFKGGL